VILCQQSLPSPAICPAGRVRRNGSGAIQTPPTEYSLRSGAVTATEHHEYIYASGKLMRETITTTNGTNTTTQVLDFIYGSGSTPLALVYTNGTASPVTYYYVTNMQGDVVRLVNASGTVVARYEYDAWGKVVSATGSMAEVNPIRYRGYYYDAETELYYLRSRYYDSAVKRFVNADGITSTGQGFTGYNMFAYCGNNPVNFADPTGNSAWIILPFIIIPLILGGCEAQSEYGAAKDYEECDAQDVNCAGYALGLDEWHNVGGEAGAVSDYDVEIVADQFMQGVKEMGRGIRPIKTYNSPIHQNEYRVALRTTTNSAGDPDYHFMVQHSDGSWSHKPGNLPSRMLEYDNPTDAPWPRYVVLFWLQNGELQMAEFATMEDCYCSQTLYFAVTWEEVT